MKAVRIGLAAAALMLSASGCASFGSEEEPSASEQRAPCDSLAAQAIDADDVAEARRLAAQASSCYAELQSRS